MPVNPCFINQASPRDIDRVITPDRVSMFWRYAKENGLAKGMTPEEVRSHMAQKFNLPERVVAQILDKPKTVRKVSEEVKARQKTTARFLSDNRRYLANMDKTLVQKTTNFLTDGVRSTLLSMHGPVIPMTHGLDTAFVTPVKFVKTWVRSFVSLNPRQVELFYSKMEADPLYKTFKDAGAVIGREDHAEGFGKTGWAARAMEAMKPLRFEWMKSEWNTLKPELRTKEMAQELALQSAHATGAMLKSEPAMRGTGLIRKAMLAPQLTFSKWMKTLVDPLTTINTFARAVESKFNRNMRPPTPEERRIAWIRTRNAGIWTGVLFGGLKLNQAILQANGSDQKVNMSDPKRGDFLAFKVGGHYIRTRGSQEIIAFLARLAAVTMQKPKFGQQSPEEVMGRYGEYKLAPHFGIAKELMGGKDFLGRPLPWSDDPGKPKFPRLEYPEWAAQHGPIFLGHGVSAFYESLREQGVDVHDLNKIMRAMVSNPKAIESALLEGGAEFFGVNLQKDRYSDLDSAMKDRHLNRVRDSLRQRGR